MGTQLSTLSQRVMDLLSNRDIVSYVDTWVNWAIREIWEYDLWDFRVREGATLNFSAQEFEKTLATDFSKPLAFRLTTVDHQRVLLPFNRERMALADPDWRNTTDTSKLSTPRYYITPIVNNQDVVKLQVYPVCDKAYTVDYEYYSDHPALAPDENCHIPSRFDHVVILKAASYVKFYDDEVDVRPFERMFLEKLREMRRVFRTNPNTLPSGIHERALQETQKVGGLWRNDIDWR